MAVLRRVLTCCEQTRQMFQIEFMQAGATTWEAAKVFTPRGGGRGAAPGGNTAVPGGRPRVPTQPPLEGSFTIGTAYPGCPYCQATGFFRCGSCAQLNCWNEQGTWTTCGLCGNAGQIAGSIDSLAPEPPPPTGPTALGNQGPGGRPPRPLPPGRTPRPQIPPGPRRPLLPPKG